MSELQKFTRNRNHAKMRISGISYDTSVFSENELHILEEIYRLRDTLLEGWDFEYENNLKPKFLEEKSTLGTKIKAPILEEVEEDKQGIQETESTEKKDMPKLLKWVANDIITEEMETLKSNGLEWKQVARECNNRVRQYYFSVI